MNPLTTDQPAPRSAADLAEVAVVPTTTPRDDLRRANRRLVTGLLLFAVALATACFLWMYGRMVGQREAERAAAASPIQVAAPANPSPSPVAPR